MKKFLSFIFAVSALCLCLTFSACGDSEEVKLEMLDGEQWKIAVENSRNAESYSYSCIYNMYEKDGSGEKRTNINSDINGKIDNINDVYYYEFFDSGSVFPNDSSAGFMFGKYYFSGDNTYTSYTNSDGSFGDWEKTGIAMLKESVDILKSTTSEIFTNGEKLLSDLYESFVFDEASYSYSAAFNVYGTDIDVKVTFKNGKIYNLDTITKSYSHSTNPETGESTITSEMVISYSLTFFDYNSTAVQLPEELKNL